MEPVGSRSPNTLSALEDHVVTDPPGTAVTIYHKILG